MPIFSSRPAPGWIVAACTLVGLLVARPAAAEVRVAVAANFTEPAREIAAAFERTHHEHVVLSFGASGQLYAQIANGAPLDVFLSADAERPAAADRAGLTVPGSRFTYATGRLVLWSRGPGPVGPQALTQGRYERLAIADPAAAPYGLAAVQTLQKLGVYPQVKPRLVQGSSITQAFQFVSTGNAPAGFVSLSQVIDQPAASRWIVPERLHAPILQQAVLLRTAAGNRSAAAFMAYLKGPQAKAVIRRYGYDVR